MNVLECSLHAPNKHHLSRPSLVGVFFLLIFSPQDPLDPAGTAIVISSLVAGGVAERGGQILPGDRLVFVNEKYLDGATLAEAVEVLKSVPTGTVSLGICKPLVVRTDFNYFFSYLLLWRV